MSETRYDLYLYRLDRSKTVGIVEDISYEDAKKMAIEWLNDSDLNDCMLVETGCIVFKDWDVYDILEEGK